MSATASATIQASSSDCSQMPVFRVVQAPRITLPALVEQLLRGFDGRRSLEEVCQQAQISVAKGQAVVRKLTQLGIIETVTHPVIHLAKTPKTRTSMSAFTPEEEAFFASEVEPIDECDEEFESMGEKVSLFVSDLILRLKGSPAF